MENLAKNGEIMSQEHITCDMLSNAIKVKDEPCDHYSRSCQPVNGVITDKDIKTECVNLFNHDMEVTKSTNTNSSSSKCLILCKAEKNGERETALIPESEINGMDMILGVTDVKKEHYDNVVVSDSSSEDHYYFYGDEKVELSRTSGNLTEKLRAVCKELKEEKDAEMSVCQMRNSSTLHSDDTNPRANSHSMCLKVKPEMKSEKSDCEACSKEYEGALLTVSDCQDDYGDGHAKELSIQIETVDKLNQTGPIKVGEENHLEPLVNSSESFSFDKCYRTFTGPARLLKHRRIHPYEYRKQQNTSKTTEHTYTSFHRKESITAKAKRSIMNYPITTKSNMKVQRMETENLNSVMSLSSERHLTEQNPGYQVVEDCTTSSISDNKQFQNILVCSKTFPVSNKYENLDSESRQECDDLQYKRVHIQKKPYKCDVCNAGFARTTYLKGHKRIHTGEKPYKCDDCGVFFARKSDLNVHKRKHTGEKPYKCDVCGGGFYRNNDLQVHQRRHRGEKPYKCDVCGVGFPRKSDLTVHQRRHTGEKPYKCDVCGVDFAEVGSLKCHKRIHTGEKPYKCEVCSVDFAELGNLKRHKRIHTGERPYKCDICGVDFAEMGSLKRHKMIHSGEKPYKCNVCGVDFAGAGNLKRHKRIHTEEKPYKCDVCGVGFTRAGNLHYHKRIHTGEKPYRCDVCGEGFARTGPLQHHKRIHTGEKL